MPSIQACAWESIGPKVEAYGPKPKFFVPAISGDGDNFVQRGTRFGPRTASPSGKNAEDNAPRYPLSISRDASIVFTGPRGNGKSSLAIIAGLLLRRRVIDADDYFVTTTGLSMAAFKGKHGGEKYRNQQVESTRELLARYEKDCVIACGLCTAAEQCRAFMTEYRRTHPVIYVSRPVDDIEDYLGLKEKGKMQQWMNNIHSIYHRISNFEFFSLPERWKEDNQRCAAQERLESVLPHRLMPQKRVQALQKTQTALAIFLAAALGYNASSVSHTTFPTLYPTLPERRIYSNAMCVPITSLADEDVDIGQILAGADAVELVLDARNSQCKALVASGTVGRFVAEIRRFLAVPVIYHVHIANMRANDQTSYFDLLYHGLRFAPEYLTVNFEAPDAQIRLLNFKRGFTTIIGHQDNAAAGAHFWESAEPLEQYSRALGLGCGVVRLVKPCDSMAENVSCMTFIDKINAMPDKIPIIAHNTGDIGRLSLVYNSTLTPVLHSPSQQIQMDPSVYTPTNMTISERWSTLFALHALNPLQFFVVGSTVRNSLSPAMHNAAFQTVGMPHVYSVREANSLEELRALFKDSNFGGASVSLPFKKEILTLAKNLSPSAELIGASNTILPIRKNTENQDLCDLRSKEHRHRAGPISMLYADNTDWMGICACVSRSISPANSVNPETAGLVIGAGGMARAAVYCLWYLGVRNICIFNRTVSHAQSLANHFKEVFVKFMHRKCHNAPQPEENNHLRGLRIRVLDSIDTPWPNDLSQPSIIICAIKAYDRQKSATSPFKMPQPWMKNSTGGIVVDLAYHTPETPLMQQLREEYHPGWTAVDPIEVLFEQACAQWELFTGSRAPRKAMWEACLNEYADKMKNNAYSSM